MAESGKSSSGGKSLGVGGWVLIAALFAYAVHLADNANQSFSNEPTPAAKKPPAAAAKEPNPARQKPDPATTTAKKKKSQSNCPRDLRYGDRGEDVKRLQAALNAEDLAVAPIVVDGRFEVGTEGLVRAFQSRRFGSADGIVGEATWKKLGQCR